MKLVRRNVELLCIIFIFHMSLSIDSNECDSSPCQNNATCTDGVNRYQCQCMAGYMGQQCETGNGIR